MSKFTSELMYNALALNYVAKQPEMKADLNAVFAEEGLTVDKLLKMNGVSFLQTNANEVMNTGATGFGKEFVEKEILYSEILQRITNDGSLLTASSIKTMFADVEIFPVEGADVYMTNTTEAADKATGTTPAGQNQRAGTLNFTITAKDLVVTVEISDQLARRSVVDIANYVLDKIAKALESTIHELVINADTATAANTNINAIDGAISALPKGGAKAATLNNDGLRKIAIANNTVTSPTVIDALGNLDLSVIRAARAGMGEKGIDPTNLVLIPQRKAYFELLNLTPAETMEKFGDAATVKLGKIVAIDGMRIVYRKEFTLATDDGTISVTSANNDKSGIIIAYQPAINVGIREGLTTEEQRYASEKITAVTGSAVVGVTIENVTKDLDGSPAALIVNI